MTRQKIADFCSLAFAVISVAVICGGALSLLWKTLAAGIGHVSWGFLFESMPDGNVLAGGIFPIVVSTFLIVLVCLSVSVPLGLGTAIWLAEFSRKSPRISRWSERSIDLLASVPSIVFGLFGNALFCQLLGMGYSIMAGGLTLACMVLPILIRITREGIVTVPNEYRMGATALGVSKSTMLFRIILPHAMPSVAKGLVLGIGRALAETAALLFTSGYEIRMPRSVWDSGRSLSIHIFELANVTGGSPNANASAVVLVAMLFLIAVVTSVLTRLAGASESKVRILQGVTS